MMRPVKLRRRAKIVEPARSCQRNAGSRRRTSRRPPTFTLWLPARCRRSRRGSSTHRRQFPTASRSRICSGDGPPLREHSLTVTLAPVTVPQRPKTTWNLHRLAVRLPHAVGAPAHRRCQTVVVQELLHSDRSMPDKPSSGCLLLSGLEVVLGAESFAAVELPYDDDAFEQYRARDDVYVYRQHDAPMERQLLIVPLADGVQLPAPTVKLGIADRLRAIGSLVEFRLPALLSQLELRRRKKPRRLRRINRFDDLVVKAFDAFKSPVPRRLARFHKYQRTEFEVRTIEDDGGRSILVLAVTCRRHFEIDGTAADLIGDGVDLRGLETIDRNAPREARFLGTVVDAEGDNLVVRGPSEVATVGAQHCTVEPSLATFSAVFERALSARDLDRYEAAEWRLQAQTTSGRGYTDYLHKLCDYFQKCGAVEVAPNLHCTFRGPVAFNKDIAGSAGRLLPPVEYCFSTDRASMDLYPSRGLEKFGPFDSGTFDKKRPRILVVAPSHHQGEVETFIRRLRDGMESERVPRFQRGLVGIYRLAKIDLDWLLVELPPDGAAGAGARYLDRLKDAFNPDRPPDVAIVVLRDRDAFSEPDNPYDSVKAFLLSQGVPSQQVRLPTLRQPARSFAYTLENIAVALYAKLGGSPWTVTPTMPVAEEIVIGVGVAESGGRHAPRQRFAGITTVFSSDGSYILAASSERCRYAEFPDVLIAFVQKILRRLALERGWQRGDHVRLVFHSHQPLKKVDILRLVERAVQQLGEGILFQTAFLTVRRDHPFKIVDIHEAGREKGVELIDGGFGKKRVGVHVPARGMAIDIGGDRQLLCVTGSTLVKREGEPIPNPLLIELHPLSTYRDLNSLVRQVYHFTGLSWRSMLPVTEPVTIFYSHLVADHLVRLENVAHWSDGLLDTRLRRSRWFL